MASRGVDHSEEQSRHPGSATVWCSAERLSIGLSAAAAPASVAPLFTSVEPAVGLWNPNIVNGPVMPVSFGRNCSGNCIHAGLSEIPPQWDGDWLP